MDSWTLKGDSYSFLRSTPRTISLRHREGTPNHIEIFDITNIPSPRSAISETTCLCDIFGDDCESPSLSSSPASGAFVPPPREVERGAAASPTVDDSSGSYHTAHGSSEGEEGFEDPQEALRSPTLQTDISEGKDSERHKQTSENSGLSVEIPTSPLPCLSTESASLEVLNSLSTSRTPSPQHNSPQTLKCADRRGISSSPSLSLSSHRSSSPSRSPQPSNLGASLSSIESQLTAPLLETSGSRKSSVSSEQRPQSSNHLRELTPPTFEPRVIFSSNSPSRSSVDIYRQSGERSTTPESRDYSYSPDTQDCSPFSELRGRVSVHDLFSRGSTPDTEGPPCTPELSYCTSVAGGDTPENQDSRLSAEARSTVSTPLPRYTPPSPVRSIASTPERRVISVSPAIRYTPSPALSLGVPHTSAISDSLSKALSLVPSPEVSNLYCPKESDYTAASPEIRVTASSPEVRRRAKSPEENLALNSDHQSECFRAATSSPHITGLCYSVIQPEDGTTATFPEIAHLSTSEPIWRKLQSPEPKCQAPVRQIEPRADHEESTVTCTPDQYNNYSDLEPDNTVSTESPQPRFRSLSPEPGRYTPSPETRPYSPSPEPRDLASSPDTIHHYFLPETRNLSPLPEKREDTPSPEPRYLAPSPDTIHRYPLTETRNLSPLPEKQEDTPSPEPSYLAPSPEPSYLAPSPEPRELTPSPEPRELTPSSEPRELTPSPECRELTPSPEPRELTPSPECRELTPSPGKIHYTPSPEPIHVETHHSPSPGSRNFAPSPKEQPYNYSPKPSNILPSPEKRQLTPSTEPRDLTPSPEKRQLTPSTEPRDLTPSPEKRQLTPSTEPRDLSSSPEKSHFTPSPQPRYLTPSPEKSHFSPSPQPRDLTPSPEKSHFIPSPQVRDLTPSPKKSNFTPSPQPRDLTPSPEKSHFSPSPQPRDLTPSPEKSHFSPSPQPRDLTPSPEKSHFTPSPQPRDLTPSPEKSHFTPSPQPRDLTPSGKIHYTPEPEHFSPPDRQYTPVSEPKHNILSPEEKRHTPSPGQIHYTSSPVSSHLVPSPEQTYRNLSPEQRYHTLAPESRHHITSSGPARPTVSPEPRHNQSSADLRYQNLSPDPRHYTPSPRHLVSSHEPSLPSPIPRAEQLTPSPHSPSSRHPSPQVTDPKCLRQSPEYRIGQLSPLAPSAEPWCNPRTTESPLQEVNPYSTPQPSLFKDTPKVKRSTPSALPNHCQTARESNSVEKPPGERTFRSASEQQSEQSRITPKKTYRQTLHSSTKEKRQSNYSKNPNPPIEKQNPFHGLPVSTVDRQPDILPARQAAAISPVFRGKDPKTKFPMYSPRQNNTLETSCKAPYNRKQPSTKVIIVSREEPADDMARHVSRRRTPSPPITRFTPVHIIAPEKPYRLWQNRGRSPLNLQHQH
ncbi:hypothetical protein NHX12_011138 [Muraenolepis orangiensis]|uniref:Uncharacterized protein n=1 Tax=Muraenolepis orangiensis TaxID=630683 RepID=A0A9Q0DFR7_9TELE|nr:hypothetical protein NHX12_011138 [Muraenolepis orangiensis]